ncbi:pectate lyase [Flavisolibacter tropicus]|uniref:Pectate lyase n=1 Tax=Flavisolibacter tropicus TaxID=1492898 RepID=A0A172U2B3_9BACT|nr:pectate lyase [Flavisolibacter tropicus]
MACAQPKVIGHDIEKEDLPIAFPGAEGYGKYTTGGRGGAVYVVTTLNDNGSGSLRDAVSKKEPRVIVFAVSGTIHLASPLSIKGNKTIAGQTAPGDGICIADHPVDLSGDNIIVRYLRFRMGDRYQNGGKVDGSGHDDAFSGTRRKNIIIDHCSMSWSTDELFSVYAGDSTTLQWNLMAEPLNYSYHFEKGDADFENHGYGAIWGGLHLSAHHNLFAHCTSRTPRFNGIRHTPEENVDFRNNVIYNWGHNNTYAGEGGNYNIVNNYYKYGPDTRKAVQNRILNPFKNETIPFGKFYVDGNYVDGSPDVTQNNWKGVAMDKGTEADALAAKQSQAFQSVVIPIQTATIAYEQVLQQVGASFKRDTLDQRIIKEVKTRTGRIIDVQGGYPHGTPYEQTASAWPMLKSLPALKDTDSDGMPDEWEIKNGLNPNNAADSAGYSLHKQYTNIEVYINSLTGLL